MTEVQVLQEIDAETKAVDCKDPKSSNELFKKEENKINIDVFYQVIPNIYVPSKPDTEIKNDRLKRAQEKL